MRIGREWIFRFVVAVLVFVVIEATAYTVGQRLGGVYYKPLGVEGYEHYLAIRDPVLGWPAPSSFGKGAFDISGSRPIPAFPDPSRACVSIYGDSMTYGDEVGDAEAWSNVLSELLGCRVANYGVGGYGTDQALLRFEKNTTDAAETVILGHLSENIMRNVNQFRSVLLPHSFGLKPRFVLGSDGGLELVPLPTFSPEQYAQVVRDPDSWLPHEYFRLHDPAVMKTLRFPYTLSVLASFDQFRVRAGFARRPSHAEFYAADHPSQALEITTRILERFDRGARERHKRPLVLVIAAGTDFKYERRTGNWDYQPLLDALTERGIEPFNAGAAMLAAIGPDRNPCELFRNCSGHFNAEGYALLARVVHDELARRGMIPAVVAGTARSNEPAEGQHSP